MNSDFIEALRALETEKGIKKDVLIESIEAALVTAYKRDNGECDCVVTIDRNNGKMSVTRRWRVTDEVEDPETEKTFAEGRLVDPSCEIGDYVSRDVTPKSFGRIAAQTAKQIVVQKIREEERSSIYDSYIDSEDDMVTAVVKRVDKRSVYLDIGRTEAYLAPSEMMPNDDYKPGDYIKVYVLKVDRANVGPQIMVSRTHPNLVKRLFESEVPEIKSGTVEIRSIAREAGFRTKIAVSCATSGIDPVGSCVGQRGTRVERVVEELHGEKIDIVRWSDDPAELISNALSPARVLNVWINEQGRAARVLVPDNQLSLAIGREGQNARLAAKLTGWKIDIKNQQQMAELFASDEAEAEAPEAPVESDFEAIFGSGSEGTTL